MADNVLPYSGSWVVKFNQRFFADFIKAKIFRVRMFLMQKRGSQPSFVCN